MKALLLLATVALVSSCGMAEGLNKNCGSDLRMGCNLVFGMKDADQDEQIAKNTFKNDEQDAKITELETKNEQLIESMSAFSVQISQLQATDTFNKTYLEGLINALQNTVTANFVTLTVLQSDLSGSIAAMVDVCGDHVGHFDEVILKTRNGKYVAYFEQGSKRFLTELSVGAYQTTDAQACSFTVTTSGITHIANNIIRVD